MAIVYNLSTLHVLIFLVLGSICYSSTVSLLWFNNNENYIMFAFKLILINFVFKGTLLVY